MQTKFLFLSPVRQRAFLMTPCLLSSEGKLYPPGSRCYNFDTRRLRRVRSLEEHDGKLQMLTYIPCVALQINVCIRPTDFSLRWAQRIFIGVPELQLVVIPCAELQQPGVLSLRSCCQLGPTGTFHPLQSSDNPAVSEHKPDCKMNWGARPGPGISGRCRITLP